MYSETAIFGSFKITSNGRDDIFICKYDSDGNEQWLRSFGSWSNEFSGKLAVDRDANIYITGDINGNVILDADTIVASYHDDLILVKFDSEGNYLSFRQEVCFGSCAWREILFDEANNLFLAGFFSDLVVFDGQIIPGSESGYTGLYTLIDSNNDVKWITHTTTGFCEPSSMASLNDSTLISTGTMIRPVDFGDTLITPFGSKDIFVTTLSKGIEIIPSEQNDFLIYPNPFTSSISMEFQDASEKELIIFATTGAIVHQSIIPSNILTLDLGFLSSGMYLVQIKSSSNQWTARVIKE